MDKTPLCPVHLHARLPSGAIGPPEAQGCPVYRYSCRFRARGRGVCPVYREGLLSTLGNLGVSGLSVPRAEFTRFGPRYVRFIGTRRPIPNPGQLSKYVRFIGTQPTFRDAASQWVSSTTSGGRLFTAKYVRFIATPQSQSAAHGQVPSAVKLERRLDESRGYVQITAQIMTFTIVDEIVRLTFMKMERSYRIAVSRDGTS